MVEAVPVKKTRKAATGMMIVSSGSDEYNQHRGDFVSCPHCDYKAEHHDEWDKYATTLALEPRCYKAGSVSVIAECPKCFQPSWVHESMDGFDYNNAWPVEWKEAVELKEAAVKLAALREWGGGICHSCKHLESGSVVFNAWRKCIRGSGPAAKACDRYERVSP